MASYTYIKLDNRNTYVTFNEYLDPVYNNNIGVTWEDYLDNMWVLLTDEQYLFHLEHPELSVQCVWNMEVPQPHQRTLDEAKKSMINKITKYDESDEVNAFIVRFPSNSEKAVNGFAEEKAWLTQQERSNYRSSIDSAKLLGVEELSLFIGEREATLPTAEAEGLLARIQLYADACFIVTKLHKQEVNALTTIEEVDEYAYNTGYPEMLVFTLS